MLRFAIAATAACSATATITTEWVNGVPPMKAPVTSLPGWEGPLPSDTFSGYIDAGTPPSGVGTMYFHYIAALSEGDPATDPVVLWYNGGPGASSLFGMLQELGPVLFNVRSFDDKYNQTGIPSGVRNPYSWTKFATVIAVDSPPPIGFSFCTEHGVVSNGTACGAWTDKTVFAANHAAHRTLFQKVFPEFITGKNPVFFTGESYGGIYVPGFVDAMLDDPIPGLNFAGYAVGDGWTGCKPVAGRKADWCVDLDNVGLFQYPNVAPGPWYDMEFMHGHSQFSETLYRKMRAACTEAQWRAADGSDVPADCMKLVDQMKYEVGGYYAYDLYNDCPTNDRRRLAEHPAGAKPYRGPPSDKHGMFRSLRARKNLLRNVAHARGFRNPVDPGYGPGAHQAGGGAPCPSTAMDELLALDATLDALSIPRGASFINLDNGHGFDYTPDEPQVTPIYKRALEAGLRVLIYEGDSDPCGLQTAPVEDIFVDYFASINLNETKSWRPWTTDGAQRLGGYAIEWIDRQVQFVSIRGSGHLVPENKPDISKYMMSTFIAGEPFLPWVDPPAMKRHGEL